MLSQWTGELVGKLHLHGITQLELANELGYSPEYVSSVLNGKRSPKEAEQKFNDAFIRIISRGEIEV